MKTKRLVVRSIGVLSALLVFVALPNSVLANCGQCEDVGPETYYGTGHNLYIEVECPYPAGAFIYYTTNLADPIINSDGTPGANTLKVANGTLIPITYMTTLHIRAKADLGSCWYESVNIVDYEQHNPNL